MWSARTAGFIELLDRVQKQSGESYAELFDFAKAVGCLCVDKVEDREARMRLTQSILLATTEWLEDLRANLETNEITGVQKLRALSEQYLAELRSSQ